MHPLHEDRRDTPCAAKIDGRTDRNVLTRRGFRFFSSLTGTTTAIDSPHPPTGSSKASDGLKPTAAAASAGSQRNDTALVDGALHKRAPARACIHGTRPALVRKQQQRRRYQPYVQAWTRPGPAASSAGLCGMCKRQAAPHPAWRGEHPARWGRRGARGWHGAGVCGPLRARTVGPRGPPWHTAHKRPPLKASRCTAPRTRPPHSPPLPLHARVPPR